MSTTRLTTETDATFSPYVHTWETETGERLFFDALTLDVVRSDAETVGDALADPDVRTRLRNAGMLGGGSPDPDDRWEPLRDRKISTLYVVLNRDCNFGCGYCFLPPEERAIDPEDARRAVDLLDETDRDRKHIVFYGGEPLLSLDLVRDLVAETDDSWGYSVVTNGTLVSTEVASFLADNGFKVSVSIDGPPEVHNRTRRFPDGSGTYDRVVEGARNLERVGHPYQVLCTVNEHNVADLPQTVAHLDAEFDHRGISLNFPCLSGKGDEGPTAGVAPDELAEAWLALVESYAEGDLDTLPTNIYHRWIRPLSEGVPAQLYCAGCRTHAVVSPNGKLGPCMAADTHPETDEETFWRDLDELDSIEAYEESALMDDWQATLPVDREACHDCPGFTLCGGGCPYDGYALTGDIRTKDPRFCEFVRRLVTGVVERWG